MGISLIITTEEIQKLIEQDKGDSGRLNYILNSLNQGKKLYGSDQKYVESLVHPELPKQNDGSSQTENNMIITTTNSIDGCTIQHYLGIVSGEAVMGSNIFRDVFAGVRDIIGGRSGQYEKKFRQAKELAISEMMEQTKENDANAIVGIKIDYEMVRESMMMVSAQGTAVKIVRE